MNLLVCRVQVAKFLEPEVGTVDLAAWLDFAAGDVSLGPLAEARGDLLDAAEWVALVVAAEVGVLGLVATVNGSSLTGIWVWATVGEKVLVIEGAELPASLEAGNVSVELGDPVGSLVSGQVVGAPLLGEGSEFGQTLKGVSWWDLLVIGRGGGNKSNGESFHFFLFFTISRVYVSLYLIGIL